MYVSVFSISVLMSSQTQRRSRSLSPVSTPRLNVPRRKRSLERTRNEEVFLDDDDDDWIFDPAIDEILNKTSKRTHDEAFSDDDEEDMPYGGGVATPLLDFNLRPLGARRNWRNVLNKQRFEATLQQHRDATNKDDLGIEVTQALRRAIDRQIASDDTLTPHSNVHFTMQSNTFTHAFQSTTFPVREFREGSERLDTYLQAIAAKLNSNEEFTPNNTFTMETTFIRTPGPGSGRKRYKPSNAAIHGITKKSVVTIKNDELCCARAIVTMKAYAGPDYDSRDQDYHNLKQGRPIQERLAKELHRLAGVPEGPCGRAELEKFQAVFLHHQIKVISRTAPYQVIFFGTPPQRTTKIIRIIKEGDHYNGCNSFTGFM